MVRHGAFVPVVRDKRPCSDGRTRLLATRKSTARDGVVRPRSVASNVYAGFPACRRLRGYEHRRLPHALLRLRTSDSLPRSRAVGIVAQGRPVLVNDGRPVHRLTMRRGSILSGQPDSRVRYATAVQSMIHHRPDAFPTGLMLAVNTLLGVNVKCETCDLTTGDVRDGHCFLHREYPRPLVSFGGHYPRRSYLGNEYESEPICEAPRPKR